MKLIVLLALLFVPFVYAAECDVPEAYATPPETPTEVSIGLYVVDVTDVSDVEQTFTADVLVRQQWTDDRLMRFNECNLAVEDIWTSESLFLNIRDEDLSYETLTVEDGRVELLQRFYGDFSAPLDLREFPFDESNLYISLLPYASIDDVVYTVDEEFTGAREAVTSFAERTIEEGSAYTYDSPSKADGKIRSVYEYAFSAKRYPTFYIWKLIFPLTLIVFMSWAVFWINPKDFGPQLSVAMISMLNIIAYNFAISSFLPKISYLTSADKFTTGCVILIFLVLIEAVTTSSLAGKKKIKSAKRIDYVCRFLFPIAFLGLLLYAFA